MHYPSTYYPGCTVLNSLSRPSASTTSSSSNSLRRRPPRTSSPASSCSTPSAPSTTQGGNSIDILDLGHLIGLVFGSFMSRQYRDITSELAIWNNYGDFQILCWFADWPQSAIVPYGQLWRTSKHFIHFIFVSNLLLTSKQKFCFIKRPMH